MHTKIKIAYSICAKTDMIILITPFKGDLVYELKWCHNKIIYKYWDV